MFCAEGLSSPLPLKHRLPPPSPDEVVEPAVFELLFTTVDFLGAGLDTGAQRTVIGIQQAEAYI